MRTGRIIRRCQACGAAVGKGLRACACGSDRLAWSFVVDVSRPGEPRKQAHRSGIATRAEAVRAMAAAQDRAEKNEPEPSRMTLSAWLDLWIESRRGDLRGGTWASYRDAVRLYVKPTAGDLQLRSITKARLRSLYADLADHGGRKGRPLSSKTVHNVSLVVRTALAAAVEDRLIVANPGERAHRLPTARAEMHVWDGSQVGRFLAAVSADRLACLWRLAFATGARRGELLGVRWSDLDLDAGGLSIQQTWSRGASGLVFGSPKTAAGRRRIALDPETVAALRVHRKAQLAERMRAGSVWQGADLVFCTTVGTPLDPDSTTETFERLAARAKLPKIRFHDARHSSASLLLAAGVPVKAVSQRLGHADASTTLRVYAHVLPGADEDAAARLAAAIGGSSR